jgi:hypothetical protein
MWLILGLAANWLIPFWLCWSYATVSYLVGDFVHTGRYGPFIKFRLSYKMRKWHDRMWQDWGGVGLFLFMVYRDEVGPEDSAEVARTIVHEGTHCWHWLWLGSLFYVAYAGHMAFIYFFQKDKHPYLDCWSERLARRHAGQLVDVPKEQWPDGPKDRWPWW